MSDKAKLDAVLDRYSGGGWDVPDHEAMAWRIVELEAAMSPAPPFARWRGRRE